MTYRERRERKAERLREWADKRATRAASTLNTARTMADAIPFGQPILVGHHSETRDRAYRGRIESKFRRAFEDDQKARDMSSRAAGIDAQAEHAIYSDDPDAIERLRERIAELETQREQMNARNAEYRKTHRAELKAAASAYERSQMVPHAPYEFQNLGGNITRQKKRLDEMLSGARTPQPPPTDTSTATARAGLMVRATMTTPSRAGKQPRPVWNVTGNIGEHRPMLTRLGGNWYRGVFSFWDDPTVYIETACAAAEAPIPLADFMHQIEQAEATAPPLVEMPFTLENEPAIVAEHQPRLFNGKD